MLEHKIKLDLNIVFEVFLYAFLILEFYVYTINNNTLIIYIRTFFLISTAVVGCFLFVWHRDSLKTIIYILLIVISWIVCSLVTTDGAYFYDWDLMKYTLCYIGVALGLISHKNGLLPAFLIYYAVVIDTLIRIVILGEDIHMFMLSGSSYNYIPVIIMLYLMIYLIIRHQNGMGISLPATLLFFAVTVVSYGRSSMIAGAVLLALAVYQNYVGSTNKWYRLFLIGVSILCIVVMLAFILGASELFNSLFGKFLSMGLDSNGRMSIWGTYIQDCLYSWQDFFFGGNAYLAHPDDGNLHNIFLQMHASFGLIFTVVNVWVICGFIIRSIKKKDIFITCLLIGFLVKAFFDKIVFLGYNEIVYFYFMFYYFEEYSNSKIFCVIKKSGD